MYRGQTQLMLAGEPSEPLMIDRLAHSLLKLRQDPTVAVSGMLLNDLAYVVH